MRQTHFLWIIVHCNSAITSVKLNILDYWELEYFLIQKPRNISGVLIGIQKTDGCLLAETLVYSDL